MRTILNLTLYDLYSISVRLGLGIEEWQQVENETVKLKNILSNQKSYKPNIIISVKDTETIIATKNQLLSLQANQYEIVKGKTELLAIERYVKNQHLFTNLNDESINPQTMTENEWKEYFQRIQDQILQNSTDPILHSCTIEVTVHQ